MNLFLSSWHHGKDFSFSGHINCSVTCTKHVQTVVHTNNIKKHFICFLWRLTCANHIQVHHYKLRFYRFSREWHHENKQCQITRRYSSSHNHPKGIHAQSRVEALAGWQITTGEKVPKALEKCVFQSELKGPGPKPVNFFNAHLG